MVSKTDIVPSLKGLTIWLVQLNDKELTSLRSCRVFCKCFMRINSFGPHRLNDEVSILLLSVGTIVVILQMRKLRQRGYLPGRWRAGMQTQAIWYWTPHFTATPNHPFNHRHTKHTPIYTDHTTIYTTSTWAHQHLKACTIVHT